MILILANPSAGRARCKKTIPALNKIKQIFEKTDDVELVWVERKEDVIRLANQASLDGVRLVVAAGGDGTIHEVANGLAGTNTTLSILPFGTENVFAKYFRLPLNPEQCAMEIMRREKRQVDLGKIGGRYFVLFAGIGFDAQVVRETNKQLKDKIGSLAFALTGLQQFWELRHHKQIYTLNHDGVVVDWTGWFMLVGNIPKYGWRLSMLPSAQIQDGKLDACFFHSTTFWGKVKQAFSVFRGNHYEKTRCFQFKTLTIECNPPVEIQADGELIGRTPCEISIAPKALSIQL